MSNEVEISDEGNITTKVGKTLANLRNSLSGAGVVDRDSDDLATSVGKKFNLGDRRWNISSVGISHRLNNYLISPTNHHAANANRVGVVSCRQFNRSSY